MTAPFTLSTLPRPWADPRWYDEVHAWIESALQSHDLTAVAPWDPPRIRPWSVVIRVPTNAGACYFKAAGPLSVFETGLTQTLFRRRPGCMPELMAFDAAQGWMLHADGGDTLRTLLQAEKSLGHWLRILPEYAELQIAMADHLDELLASGAPDRRLARLPDQYEALLEETSDLRIGQPDGLSAEEYRRLLDLRPWVAARCAELASFGLPQTIQHDDFHDGNIFVRDGCYSFFDWGDACITHPFCTLLVSLRSIAFRFDLAEGAPELNQLRDAYLAPWTGFAPRDRLLVAAELAQKVGILCRVFSWRAALYGADEEDVAPYLDAVPGWLQELLSAGPM